MSVIVEQPKDLESIRSLVASMLTVGQKIDIVGFVDQLLLAVAEFGRIHCTPRAEGVLCFKAPSMACCEVEVGLGRTLLRTVCARLSVVCGERTGKEVSPYGDKVEFDWSIEPERQIHFVICFTNTPDRQEFDIQAVKVLE